MGTRLSRVLGNSRHIVGNELALLRLLGMGRRHASLHMLLRRQSAMLEGQQKRRTSKAGSIGRRLSAGDVRITRRRIVPRAQFNRRR